MDLKAFKTSDWLKVGGGALMLIADSCRGQDRCGLSDFGVSEPSWSAFSFFFRGTIPWLLVVAIGVLTFLKVGMKIELGKLPWALIFIAASGLSCCSCSCS